MVGSAGGLIMLWNEELVSIKDCISCKWCIILVVVLNKSNQDLVMCNVYAPNSERERRDLWDYILNVQLSYNCPWVLGGDFNTVEINNGVS